MRLVFVFILSGMKSQEWSPTRCNHALGLIAGGRHSLSKITSITNIPKGTLGDLKKRGTGISKPQSGGPKKFSTLDKHQIDLYIHCNATTRGLTPKSIIKSLSLNVFLKTIGNMLKELGYTYEVVVRHPFLKDLDRK
jgi:hypothetical protein